jgi:hypothetical protein
MRSRLCVLSLSAALLACGGGGDNNRDNDNDKSLKSDDGVAEERARCEDTATPITASAPTSLGAKGADLLAALPAAGGGEVAWGEAAWGEGQNEGPFTFAIEADEGSLRFIKSTYVAPNTDGIVLDIGVTCADSIAADAVVRLKVEDAGLDAALAATFILLEDEEGEGWRVLASGDVEAADLGPDFDLGAYVDPTAYETLRIFLTATVREGVLSATLMAQGTYSDGVVAGAKNIDIAHFDSNGELERSPG